MGRGLKPEMSVVLVTPGDYRFVRETVEHLRAQTARDRLEVVIVTPSSEGFFPDPSEMQDFHSYRLVEAGRIESTGPARAAGVLAASAPVVAFAEEHCFPEPGWAEALIKAHAEGWAAVGPVVSNANPQGATSWANFLISFAPWAEGATGGEADSLPWHNTSYKRSLLVEYGAALGEMLEAEGLIQKELCAAGRRLYVESAARTRHLNITRLSSYLLEQFHAGRRFAAARSRRERWTPPRRLVYAVGTALTPPAQMRRVLRETRRPGRASGLLPRILPPLAAGLLAHAAGEMTGYAFGAGDSYRRSSELEFHHRSRQSGREAATGDALSAAGE